MNELTKVSIVIPVYNGSNYLAQAVESALDQTYSNIEILVVNDGSEDTGATERIARSFGNRIRYITKRNGGVSSALNAGIAAMTGDFFAWLSHDDLFLPEKIELQMAALRKWPNAGLCFTDYHLIDGEGRVFKTVTSMLYAPDRFLRHQLLGNCINGSSVVIDRRKLTSSAPFNENHRYTQDGELWIRLLREGVIFTKVDQPLLKYRVHSAADSFTASAKHRQEEQNLYRTVSRSLHVKEVFPEFEGTLSELEERTFIYRWLGGLLQQKEGFHSLGREFLIQSLKLRPLPWNPALLSLFMSAFSLPIQYCRPVARFVKRRVFRIYPKDEIKS